MKSITAASLARCEKALGYAFKKRDLLKLALTHSSTKGEQPFSNERLEFLGDSILGMIIAAHLYKSLKGYPEGELTKIKSIVVSRQVLAEVGGRMSLKNYLVLGKGILSTKEIPPSIFSNSLEAIIGAIYLDSGIRKTEKFVLKLLSPEIEKVLANEHRKNYKSILQHLVQREMQTTPLYRQIDDSGPDHKKKFKVLVTIDGEKLEAAWGYSKKEAEQKAAEKTLKTLRRRRKARK